jgi:hypothetical protein
MFSLFGPSSELGIVFHIGSSSVGAGLLRLKKGEIPHVIYALRELIPYHENVEADTFLAETIDAIKRVNVRMAKDGLSHLKFTEFGSLKIKQVYYVFASPWSVTQTKIATIKKNEPFVLTKEMVDAVVDEQEKIFEKATLGKEEFVDQLQAIEKRVIQVKLNGYEVAEPYGRKANVADISLFVSIIPKAVVARMFDVSMTTYHPKDTSIFSFSLASFSTLRDVFHAENDFIFIDIGGELSDISIIKDGLILETASFPLGRNFLIRKLSKLYSGSHEETASLIKLYHEGGAEPSLEQKLKPLMAEATEEWLTAFGSVLTKISERIPLPTSIFAVINNDFVDFFMKALRSEKVSEFSVVDVPLSVTLINHDKLKSAVLFGKHAEKDPFIAILAAFVGRVYETKKR